MADILQKNLVQSIFDNHNFKFESQVKSKSTIILAVASTLSICFITTFTHDSNFKYESLSSLSSSLISLSITNLCRMDKKGHIGTIYHVILDASDLSLLSCCRSDLKSATKETKQLKLLRSDHVQGKYQGLLQICAFKSRKLC
ncbi:hypothetical protein ACET3Z_007578 [Daucus carota]